MVECIPSLGKIFGRQKFLTGLLFLLGQQLKGRFLFFDYLKTRNINAVNWCCMCKNSEESAPRHEHKLLSTSGVNTFGLRDNWFWCVGLVACRFC